MALPTTHENTKTAAGSSHLTVDDSSRHSRERASPASDCGTKRPLDEGATTESDTRAKRARKTPVDSPVGTPQVEQANIESNSTISPAPPLSLAPEPSDQVWSGDGIFMSIEDAIENGSPIQIDNVEEPTPRCAYLSLPFDVLADILILVEHPKDILAVARTCKQTCTQLVSPAASFVWKKARLALGLPDPLGYETTVKNLPMSIGSIQSVVGVGCFVDREPAYAAFVFDGGICEVCNEPTNRAYISFALKLRICDKPRCRKEIQTDLTPAYMTWLPAIESSSVFDPRHVPTYWPKTTLTRKPLLLEATEQSITHQDMAKIVLTVARNNVWMQFCIDLYKWHNKWESKMRHIKQQNEVQGKDFAKNEGWNYSNMLADTSYGQFYEGKSRRREMIAIEELENMRPTIARELLQAQEKRHWKTVTKLRQANINSIWKFYQKLLSQRTEYPYVPSFGVFLQLPAIKILQSSDMAAAELSVKAAVGGKKSGAFMLNMVKQQIDSWAEGVKREMLEKLGGSSEWNKLVPTRRMPHPVLRLEARWKCQICDSVEPKYEIDECLDFAGVCRHECREKDGMKRKKGEATQAWSSSNFVKDEQACAVITACLESAWLKKELVDTVEETRRLFLGTRWRCLSCDPPLLVPAGCLIGHSHRHPVPMKVDYVGSINVSILRRLNVPGIARWLKQGSKLAKEWGKRDNYACFHCANAKANEEQAKKEQNMSVDDPQHSESHEISQVTATGSETRNLENIAEKDQASATGEDKEKKKKQFENRFTFNGLRSHLSSKHKIYQIRDEDFYCHRTIKLPDGPVSVAMLLEFTAAMLQPDW